MSPDNHYIISYNLEYVYFNHKVYTILLIIKIFKFFFKIC
jgi:hypothetical protein